MKLFSILFISLIAISPQTSFGATSTVKKNEMIKQSILNYKGRCPCPYNTMKNGRSCGKNSAWSKPGGSSPLCYLSDIK